MGHVITGIGGYAAAHASYKGINIDSLLIYEREVTYHHAGFSQWANEDWNFIESGNIVTFNTDKAQCNRLNRIITAFSKYFVFVLIKTSPVPIKRCG